MRFGRDTFVLRPLGPGDAHRLQEFFYSHNSDTIWMRYGHAVAQMTAERATALVGVDQSRDIALAITAAKDGNEVIHAVGRYYLDGDERGAEAAFVVREALRGRGIATKLLSTLIAIARARGLDFLWGRVHRGNAPMIAVFRRLGGRFVPSTDPDDHDLRIKIDLKRRTKL